MASAFLNFFRDFGIWSLMSIENADREMMIENSILSDPIPYGSLKYSRTIANLNLLALMKSFLDLIMWFIDMTHD